MTSTVHPAHGMPNAATPATRPGEQPLPAVRTQDEPHRDATPVGGAPHSPKRDGDNSGGESTASAGQSNDKGHQRAPRPGAEEHQGGH